MYNQRDLGRYWQESVFSIIRKAKRIADLINERSKLNEETDKGFYIEHWCRCVRCR